MARDSSKPGVRQYLTAGFSIRDGLPVASSIDTFLETHSKDAAIEICGKLAIVSSILEAEKGSCLAPDNEGRINLRHKEVQASWLPLLAKRLMVGVDVDNMVSVFKNISFIIFNYDRCVQSFLLEALRRYYLITKEAAADLVNNASFFHPYGVVGRLEWQVGHATTSTFGERVAPENVIKLAKEIQTFSEQVRDDQSLNLIREAYFNAQTVVFLGFGYGEQNMELLSGRNAGVTHNAQARRVFGTTFGFSDNDRVLFAQDVKESLKPASSLKVELHKATCAGLFNEYSRGLTQ